MPAGNNKKRKSVVDFKTVKRKLGRQYKSASHTNLSFQTRSIFMPTQSVAEEKEGFVNARNLSLPDILTQCRHYNETTRREAVNELKDFLLKFPVVMEKHLSSICDKLVELMLDSSGDVRMALYTLLDEVLPMLPETLVSPFFPLWVAYISTGMTHVNGAVRLDALQYTNLWLHYHPSLVAKYHSKLLPHFMTLMTMRDPPPTAGDGNERIRRLPQKEKSGANGKPAMHAAKLHIPNALKMKNVLLASLYELVVAQLGHAELFEYKDEFEAGADCITEPPLVVPFQSSYSAEEILSANPMLKAIGSSVIENTTKQNEDFSPTESKLHLQEPECFKYFFTTIFPLLISQWIECGPESLVSHALKPLESILKLFDFLLSHLDSLIGDDPESQAAKFVFLAPYLAPLQQHVLAHFPFDYPPGFSDDELSIITHLNVLVCMVASQFYSEETRETSWGNSILNYTLRAFSGNISRPQGRNSNNKNNSMDVDGQDERKTTKKNGKKEVGLSASVHFQIVGELLPVIRRLTDHSEPQDRLNLLKAFQSFNDSCPPASASKRMSISFLSSLLLDYDLPSLDDDEDSDDGSRMKTDKQISEKSAESGNGEDEIPDEVIPFTPLPPTSSVPVSITSNLLMSLPKTLWQLQNGHEDTSKLILGVMNSFGSRFGFIDSPLRNTFNKLQPALVPFFWTSVAKKSKKTKSKEASASDASADQKPLEEAQEEERKEIFGPFVKLSAAVQKRAIDLIAHFRPLNPAMLESLLNTMSSPKVSNEVIAYFFDSIEAVGSHFESEGDFASFILSFLVAISNNACEKDDERYSKRLQRCFILARAAARACARIGMGPLFLEIIDETILQLLESITNTTTSTDQEFVLGLTLATFIGTFARHVNLSELPASLQDAVFNAVYLLIRISASSEQKAHFRPGPVMTKDIVIAIPSLLTFLLSKFEGETRGSSLLPDAHSRLLLHLVTRFPSQENRTTLSTSSTLETIVSTLKESRKSADTLLDRAIAEVQLLKAH